MSLFRLASCVALCALAAAGQEQSPFGKGPTRQVRDAENRVILTVPGKWNEKPVSGNMVLRVQAPGPYGGHDLIVVREAGQADRDNQRERYLGYDSGRMPGATIRKFDDDPIFGFRLNHPEKNRVIVRTFVTDGEDGLVLSVSSRFQYYDKLYAGLILAILDSLVIGKGGAGARSEETGESRRIHDPEARVSLIAPAIWQPLETTVSDEWMLLGLKGSRAGPRLLLKDWGGPTSAGLVLLKISARWKKAYGGITITRLGQNPPRMLVKNRVPGSVDYLTAFEAGGSGYTLALTCREDSYERYRGVADQIARTVVFAGGKYEPAEPMPGDVHVAHKKVALIHASTELEGAAAAITRALAIFERNWGRIGIGQSRSSPPIHVLVATPDKFTDTAHRFGEPPAVYDPLLCAVVVTPQPDDEEGQASWRGRFCRAMAEAALHRDLKCEPPPWLVAGLGACLEAAGHDGKSAEAEHPDHLERLKLKVMTDAHADLEEVEAMSRAEFLLSDSPDPKAMAWGYTHLLLFGRGALASFYRKWTKALAKAKGEPPPFDRKNYDKAKADLKKHVKKRWGE